MLVFVVGFVVVVVIVIEVVLLSGVKEGDVKRGARWK